MVTDCSHEIKRWLLLRRKVMTNLYRLLKSRDITLPTKVHLVKAMVFPVVMYGCESWTIKKAEHQRIDASELWCWRRLLRVPWTVRRSNQSILKEISPGYSLEGLMLKLKLLYFGHLMRRVDSLEKTLTGIFLNWCNSPCNTSVLGEQKLNGGWSIVQDLCLINEAAKSWLIGKDPNAGRDWEQKEKGTTEDEMAGWHHRLDGHEFE